MTEEINSNTPMQELTPGGDIYEAGNARNFKTGDWRSQKPIYLSEKCKQCGLCFPVCPDDAIPVGKDQKRTDFNYDYCKGCGVCAKVCPFGAIVMELTNEIRHLAVSNFLKNFSMYLCTISKFFNRFPCNIPNFLRFKK